MKLIWDAPQDLKTDRKFEEIILPNGVYTFTITKAIPTKFNGIGRL